MYTDPLEFILAELVLYLESLDKLSDILVTTLSEGVTCRKRISQATPS